LSVDAGFGISRIETGVSGRELHDVVHVSIHRDLIQLVGVFEVATRTMATPTAATARS
jgi:hypothetical protein